MKAPNNLLETTFENLAIYDPLTMQNDDITESPGIYFWFNRHLWKTKKKIKIEYIGKAVASGGLKRRIMKEHLRPGFLQPASKPLSKKEKFQRENPIFDDKRGDCTDRSSLRRTIGEKEKLKADQTVPFIKKNFLLKVMLLSAAVDSDRNAMKSKIEKLESDYIRYYNPTYNQKA